MKNPSKKLSKLEPKKIGVIDFETDPFLYGRIPKPFCADFYDGVIHKIFWGNDCAQQLIDFLKYDLHEPHLIYAHNGGKFDFHFMLHEIENPIRIINARLVSCQIGAHVLRDSYAAIPIPLSAYKKDEIDYDKFEEDVREHNKTEIIEYLKSDCEYLYQLCERFCERFDRALTVGSAAMKQLRNIYDFETVNKSHDTKFRDYYYGGRVECFERGIIKGDFKIYDVNSMYPHVMKNFLHPTGKKHVEVFGKKMDKNGVIEGLEFADFYFCRIKATLINGGLPIRLKTGLDFSLNQGEFFTTSHEIKVLLKYGCIKVESVISARAPLEVISFGDYVDKFSGEKISAKKSGDKIAELFAKFMLNSAYGKFAQNPEHYKDWLLSIDHPGGEYELEREDGDFGFYSKPIERHSYYDVAIGASITSASRAVLLEALLNATRPIYCDTDSIICESLNNVKMHDSELGAWKFEGAGDLIAIAGKKMYAVFDGKECIKSASKGAHLKPQEILKLARGESVHWKNDAPTFSLTKNTRFIQRELNRT